jgi:transcriptional regulator with XRE-family HTH domain
MPAQKLYAGAKLREVRTRIGLTQKDFAGQARRVAALSQPDGEQQPPGLDRPCPGLAQEFGLDVTELGSGDTERLVSDMREALADPVFADSRAAALRPAPRRLERTGAGPRLPRPAPRLSPDP